MRIALKSLLAIALSGFLFSAASYAQVAGDRSWFPLPEASDRAAWRELLGGKSEELIRRGESQLSYEWKVIPATAYLEFERTGDRNSMQDRQNANRKAMIDLLLAELAEGRGRFIDQLLNGCWLATEQTSWVLSAHQGRQKSGRALPDSRERVIDLGSGRYASILAITHHFFHENFDAIDPSVNIAVEAAIKRNILDPFLDPKMDKANWWLGFTRTKPEDVVNNWNPWCNTEVLLCFLLMEKDQSRLDAAIDKSVRSIAEYTSYIPQDGACEEGPSYWGEGVGKYCEWLTLRKLACGQDGLHDPLFARMVGYISRSCIGNGYVVNFADAAARGSADPELIWRCALGCGSREVRDYALYCLWNGKEFREPKVRNNDALRACMDIYNYKCMRAAVDSLNAEVATRGAGPVLAGLRALVPAATWYPETEVCFMGNGNGWFLGAKGGHNNESHNHNDVGSCVLYIDNIPVLCDAGVGTYTRQTFGTERYDIWTMQSDWHNLPMINGSSQIHGREFRSRKVVCSPEKGEFSLNLEGAYMEAAYCREWRRIYKLGKESLTITDEGKLAKRVAADTLNFLVKAQVLLPGESFRGRMLRKGEAVLLCDGDLAVKMEFDPQMEIRVAGMPLEDHKLSKVWGPVLRRVSLSCGKGLRPSYRVRFVSLQQN